MSSLVTLSRLNEKMINLWKSKPFPSSVKHREQIKVSAALNNRIT